MAVATTGTACRSVESALEKLRRVWPALYLQVWDDTMEMGVRYAIRVEVRGVFHEYRGVVQEHKAMLGDYMVEFPHEVAHKLVALMLK